MRAAPRYEPIAVTDESTVVAAYVPDPPTTRATSRRRRWKRSSSSGCSRRPTSACTITRRADLEANLRTPLEILNDVTFSDAEWKRFFANRSRRRTRHRREDRPHPGGPDPGPHPRRRHEQEHQLIDKSNIHNNRLQVINQYEVDGRVASNRYDVTILVNGLPMVHVELKRRGVARGGVQPDQPLPAGVLLGGCRPVRVRPALRDLQRHADEVLREHHPRPRSRESEGGARQEADLEHFRVHLLVDRREQQAHRRPDRRSPRRSSPSTRCSTS